MGFIMAMVTARAFHAQVHNLVDVTVVEDGARQSLSTTGTGAALASEALGLTSMMVWLG